MQIFLVGGAVRDSLLGRPVTERDWVVVGARPEDMLAAGFRPVGKDFPVFLHPQTQEEYALARTERKTGPGYHGFAFHASPDVTLEEDLRRRDLTINAIAQSPEGELVDPFDGQGDLERRQLRHVSEAFAEDPVRILRLARFAARYRPLGFTVAPETRELCRAMVAAGEVDALVPERVWQELVRALGEPAPETFIEVLRDCGALARLLPELDRLWGVPQPPQHHPEIDCGEHVLMTLRQAARLTPDTQVRFAVLLHDLGKGVTPNDVLPSHRGHEERGVPLIEAVCERLKVPTQYRDLARLVARLHLHCHRAFELRPTTVVGLFEQLDAYRRPERVEQYALACEADARGRLGLEDRHYPQPDYLRRAFAATQKVQAREFVAMGLTGTAIGEAMREARVRAVAKVKAEALAAEAPQEG